MRILATIATSAVALMGVQGVFVGLMQAVGSAVKMPEFGA
jgi:hypothetical protein